MTTARRALKRACRLLGQLAAAAFDYLLRKRAMELAVFLLAAAGSDFLTSSAKRAKSTADCGRVKAVVGNRPAGVGVSVERQQKTEGSKSVPATSEPSTFRVVQVAKEGIEALPSKTTTR